MTQPIVLQLQELTAIINAVRTQILKWVLALEKEGILGAMTVGASGNLLTTAISKFYGL